MDENMKPTMRKTWIEVTYWDCGHADHRHKTEDIATKCMEKNANKKPRPPLEIRRARWIAAMRAVVSGATWREAGEQVGVTAERARQLVHKVMRLSTHPKRFSGEYPEHDKYNVKEVRANAEFWLDRATDMAKEWNV
jgi:hypothetical protein